MQGGAQVQPEAVETGRQVARIHPRQVLHTVIIVVALLLYLGPGAMLVNTVEPRVLGIPFYVFWVMFLLPVIHIINLFLYARFMIQRERQLKELNAEPWE
jgi:hypothetical protein